MAKYLRLSAGDTVEETSLATSAGAGSAGRIPELDGSGRLDITMMPAGVGTDAVSTTAGEALSAGDFVYFDGTGKALRADATSVAKAAQGYVNTGAALSAAVTVYFDDTNSGVTGLVAGTQYFLSSATPGKLVTSAALPTGTGKIIQRLGSAQAATSLHASIQQPIVLA